MTTWSWETPTVTGVCCWPLWIPLAVNVSVEAWSYEFWISVSSLEICKFSIWGTRVEVFICSSKSPTHTQTHKRIVLIYLTISTFFLKELNFLEYTYYIHVQPLTYWSQWSSIELQMYFVCIYVSVTTQIDYLHSLLLSTVFLHLYLTYFSVLWSSSTTLMR